MELEAVSFRKIDEDGTPEVDDQAEIDKDKNKNTGVITGQDQIKRGGLDGPTPPKTGINNPHHQNNDTWCCWTCYSNPSSSTGYGWGSGPNGCCTCGGCDRDGDGDCCECDGCCDCDCGDCDCDCGDCDCGGCDCGGCDCGSVDCGSC